MRQRQRGRVYPPTFLMPAIEVSAGRRQRRRSSRGTRDEKVKGRRALPEPRFSLNPCEMFHPEAETFPPRRGFRTGGSASEGHECPIRPRAPLENAEIRHAFCSLLPPFGREGSLRLQSDPPCPQMWVCVGPRILKLDPRIHRIMKRCSFPSNGDRIFKLKARGRF